MIYVSRAVFQLHEKALFLTLPLCNGRKGLPSFASCHPVGLGLGPQSA